MSKSLFLILIIVSLIFCVPRIREINYDEEKLKDCLSKISINLDEKVEELRAYIDSIENLYSGINLQNMDLMQIKKKK
jgi:hypothetical protein